SVFRLLRRIGLAFLSALALILAACASQTKEVRIAEPSAVSASVPEAEYVLRPGDTISVNFFYFPRLDTTVKIRPDGHVSLVPIDDVKAAGYTTRQMDEILTKLYAERIENPELTVTVKDYTSHKIYVGGEVKNSGLYDLETDMTALGAILRAGGVLKTGNMESVIVIRKTQEGAPRLYAVNLKEHLNPKQETGEFHLQPLDVVYVPETFIAYLNQFVDQYIDKMIPISLNAGFNFIKHIDDDSDVTVIRQQ
ncbi:MAG: polysaccharide biosynthesis/export family protein, partial [Nitrospirota bacterium]